MNINYLFIAVFVLIVLSGTYYFSTSEELDAVSPDFTQTEAGFEEVVDVPVAALSEAELRALIAQESAAVPIEENGRIRWSRYWQPFSEAERALYGGKERTPGPIRVGVQIGHYQNDAVPEELSGLTQNGGGAVGGGTTELATVKVIAEQLALLLEAQGMVVDILPATVPVDYYADAFVSIHADGNNSPSVSGFKIAGPRFDYSGRSQPLVAALDAAYEVGTGLRRDANITRRMSGYYAFNWRRYEHALHPMTPAAIVETGFMTNPEDRALLVAQPEVVAQAIADGLVTFFATHPIE